MWWLVYAIGLTGLAVLAAVRHDRTAERRRLRGVAVVLAVLTVASLTLSMATGAHDPRYLPVPSGVAAQHQ
ncbi:hypothetical protein [Flexivirga oryzae]|uniref:Uncharacterized protein n=1 Tax=Flexivirga oryzae TaxID=1794944 RepID=A0A839N4R9_9MICO|nr:hypothetical protein [Flexivirga oryzae]MBB2891749.1 hypothetical protein [Flexivirga oryzae]